MSELLTTGDREERYYTKLAAAFVRGKIAGLAHLDDESVVAAGRAQGLRLHKFKQQAELPRVRRVLGLLRGLAPTNVLDIGSGRGTFLWPLLHAFPDLEVTAGDIDLGRVDDLAATQRGGIANLHPLQLDVTRMDLPDKSFDVVTALEVIEHLSEPEPAAAHAVRVASRFVVVSVPSKEDDNPEHLHLFTRASLERLLIRAGARNVKIEFVLNHMIAVAAV